MIHADLVKPRSAFIECTDSISCLHVIEHIGLGWYGDPIDFLDHLIALNNIHYMLKKKGLFYFSIPIGDQRIEFNAHKVFSVQYLLDCFNEQYEINNFSFVDDLGKLKENVTLTEEIIKTNAGYRYG